MGVSHPQHTQTGSKYNLYTAVSREMHSDWFNEIEIVQGRWQHGEKVGYCYPSGLEKTLCKWDIYVPLVTKGLKIHFIPLVSSKRTRVISGKGSNSIPGEERVGC
jgi:hypothetical protein